MSSPFRGCSKNNALEVGEIILDFVRKSKLPLKKLYTFVSHFLEGNKQTLCYIAYATGFGFLASEINPLRQPHPNSIGREEHK